MQPPRPEARNAFHRYVDWSAGTAPGVRARSGRAGAGASVDEFGLRLDEIPVGFGEHSHRGIRVRAAGFGDALQHR